MHVPVLLLSGETGAAASNHQRHDIPRIISRTPQVLSRTAACTCRDSKKQSRHSAARSEHWPLHLRLANLRSLCLSEQHDRYLRGRVAAAYLRARLYRVLLWLQIPLIQRVYVTAPAAPRALAALRSRVFATSQPASKQRQQRRRQQQQQQQQRRCALALEAPSAPACMPFLPSPRCFPATHSSPAGAGRCRRRHRATLRE